MADPFSGIPAYDPTQTQENPLAAFFQRVQAAKQAEAMLGQQGRQALTLEGAKATQQSALETQKEGQATRAQENLFTQQDLLEEKRAKRELANISSKAKTDKKAEDSMWKEINRRTNPNVAPRGSLLGAAGTNNARADRALANLNDPGMVTQQLDAVTADIVGIMQGGAPHDQGMAKMGFSNLLTRWANLKSVITSNPKAINNPEVVNKLRQIVNEIKDVDNKIIADNLDIAEVDYADRIDPAKWQRHRAAILKTTSGLTQPQGIEELVPIMDPQGRRGKVPKSKYVEKLKMGYRPTP